MIYADNLETARLRTRFLTEDDRSTWMEYCGDPIATTYTNLDQVSPEEMNLAWMDRQFNRYKTNKMGLQALIRKDDGVLVGMCGLIVQEVDGTEVIEVGYHLLRKHWGKGYATEAARMFRDYGFEHNVADSIASIIHPQNELSQKVAKRNDMILVETNAQFRGKEYYLFRITKEEWDNLKQVAK
jgi:RimJ/RimL family protein N-acetyltransferase